MKKTKFLLAGIAAVVLAFTGCQMITNGIDETSINSFVGKNISKNDVKGKKLVSSMADLTAAFGEIIQSESDLDAIMSAFENANLPSEFKFFIEDIEKSSTSIDTEIPSKKYTIISGTEVDVRKAIIKAKETQNSNYEGSIKVDAVATSDLGKSNLFRAVGVMIKSDAKIKYDDTAEKLTVKGNGDALVTLAFTTQNYYGVLKISTSVKANAKDVSLSSFETSNGDLNFDKIDQVLKIEFNAAICDLNGKESLSIVDCKSVKDLETQLNATMGSIGYN